MARTRRRYLTKREYNILSVLMNDVLCGEWSAVLEGSEVENATTDETDAIMEKLRTLLVVPSAAAPEKE